MLVASEDQNDFVIKMQKYSGRILLKNIMFATKYVERFCLALLCIIDNRTIYTGFAQCAQWFITS